MHRLDFATATATAALSAFDLPAAAPSAAPVVASIATRPAYHYAPAANWLSDPNGLVHVGDEWHLFYQYNPHHDQWGHMAWGHAVSTDLVAWQELAPALLEDDRHMIFSGSAVIDADDTAGFGADALVAIYTGAAHADGHQSQCLAASTDTGRHWTKFAGNPVLDLDLADFRDPNVFWHAATARWIMIVALSNEHRALLYASVDLKRWEELSAIGPFDLGGEVWECPLLIELPVEGSDATRWLFKVDLLTGGPGSGAVGLTGTFDGHRFVADERADGAGRWLVLDHGRDFYAAIAWHAPRDAAGRPCWIGWMGNHAYQRALPTRGWRGAMSVPRRIGLRADGDAFRVIQTVEPALAERFAPVATHAGATIRDTMPVAARIDLIRGGAHGVELTLRDPRGAVLALRLDRAGIAIDRASAIDPVFDAPIRAEGFDGDLQIWVDVATIEIASMDGAHWASFQHCLGGDTLAIELDSDAPVDLRVAAFRA